MNLLENATPAQREAIMHHDGALMILAGAGSGKTQVITSRIARLIHDGVPPCNVLAITFTNKAAAEMKERIETLLGRTRAWISTFHSMCARILRAHADRLGFTRDFIIYDTDDTRSCIKSLIEKTGLDSASFNPRVFAGIISRAKRDAITPDDFAACAYGPVEKAAAGLYPKYEQALHSNNCMDFDDLLLMCRRLLRENSDVLQKYADRFRYISVDEFQDTNSIQYMLARLLACKHKNICVVGDPDQTIYTWRGATLQNIFDFEKDFPGAKVIRLEQNFRSTKKILRAASELIKHNVMRKEKTLITDNPEGDEITVMESGDEQDEAVNVARFIRDCVDGGCAHHDIAVLFRVNAQSRALEESMLHHNIPYTIVGTVAFYRRKEIKDILAYLRLAVNRDDAVSFARAVNTPPRGMGQITLGRISDIASREGVTVMDVLAGKSKESPLSKRQKQNANAFCNIIEKIRAMHDKPVTDIVMEAVRLSGYQRHLEDGRDDRADDRIANMDELINAAAEYDRQNEEATLQDFLEQVALVSDTDRWDEKADRVTLMTLHSAKGLEFPVVIICGLEEGLLPHMLSMESPDQVEEERRLCFVGMTRAMKRLALTYARRRAVAGRYHDRMPSRFLNEIPADVVNIRKTAAGEPDETDGELDDDPGGFSGDLGFKGGDYVQHEHFGPGRIMSLQKRGRLTHARIFFEEDGERTVVLQYANLKREEDW